MEHRYEAFYENSSINQPISTYNTLDIDEILEEFKFYGSAPSKETKQDLCTKQFTTSATENQNQKSQQNSGVFRSSVKIIKKQTTGSTSIKSTCKKAQKKRVSQTLNLSRYFHQQIWNYLKQLYSCKLLTSQQWESIKQYENKSKCFMTNYQLFKCKKIREKCLQYFQSPIFVSKLLSSTKMEVQRKINILKYIKKHCLRIRQSKNEQESLQRNTKMKGWLN